MLGALLIVFREVLEAGLIVGIVMAATRGVPGRGRWITIGIAAGVLGAGVVAMFAGVISEAFQGSGQELFNASVLGIAVVMLMWHNAGMPRQGREIADEMRRVGTAVSEGSKPLTALAVVIGLAVLREGSEVVLFLYAIMAQGASGSALLAGGVLGIAAGAAFTALTYFGLLAIPNRHIFSVTSWLIALLAAGMSAQSVQFLNSAGLVESLDQTVWDTSWLLSEGSILGRLLHILVGYTERPTEMQLLVYVAILIAMYVLMRIARPSPRNPMPASAEGASAAPPQSGGGNDRRLIDQFEQRSRWSARLTLALLPVAHGLDRDFDLFSESSLRQPAARAHLAHEICRVAVIDRPFAAVRQDFDDPSVGLQPHPHHGPRPLHWWCRPMH